MSRRLPTLRGRVGLLLDPVEVLLEPDAEVASLAGAGEDEDRSALHRVVDHRRLDAAGVAGQLHAAVVAGDESALRGRHRHPVLTLGVLTVDQQRTGEADRDLGCADEALDVAGQDRGVDRVRGELIETRARLRLGELDTGRRGRSGVVVLGIPRDPIAFARHWTASPSLARQRGRTLPAGRTGGIPGRRQLPSVVRRRKSSNRGTVKAVSPCAGL